MLSLGLLAAPAVAAAAYIGAADDGTLNVKDGVGTVWVGGKAALVGHLDKGYVRIFDPAGDPDADVLVWGADGVQFASDTTTVYSGTNLRFRIIGRFRATVKGSDIDLSAVGQGKVGLKGTDGTYAFNGHTRQDLPDEEDLTMFDLNADSTTPGSGG